MNRSMLSTAILSALLLSACGGGGGGGGSNVRPDPAPPVPVPPSVCQDTRATNNGGALPCVYRYNGVQNNILVPTNVDLAHTAGFDGTGVKIGLLDDAQRDYSPLTGQVAVYKDFTGQGADPSTNTFNGHGALMGAIIAGNPQTGFAGGVAPGASLYWGRICYDNFCSTPQAGQAFTDFAAQGVRLFNLSIGGVTSPENASQAAEVWAFYARPLLAVDGLLVAATGNDGESNISFPAATPAFQPQYRDNWLAVANVTVDANGSPGALHATSGKCGIAANWCLVAPGLITAPAIAGTQYANGGVGTSMSTAIVTGVAALVWQAHPWMSASNVQQTVLTTATDLGAAGVDAMFGWGMVNAGKAVRGPSQFVNDFAANVTGVSVFANPISGNGGLTKRGTGTLTLADANTYTGDTLVEAGALALTGSVTSDVTVLGGATFASMGGKVTGDYTAQNASTTSIQVGTGLTVTGTAALDGTLNLLPAAATYTVKDKETLITAGSVQSTFDAVTYGSGFFYSATLDYTAQSVAATLTRTSAAGAASAASASPVAIEVGGRVDGLLEHTDGWLANGDIQGHEDLFVAAGRLMSAPTADFAAASLESMAGEIQGTTRTLGFQQASVDALLLAERADALRYTQQAGVWLQVQGADGTLRQGDYADAQYNQRGVMIGADTLLDGGAQIGVAISASKTDADLDGLAGTLESDRTGIAFYGRKDLGPVYLTAVAGYDQIDVKTRRTILLADGLEEVGANRDDALWHARIEAGYDLASGLTPFVALGAMRHDQDAFNERGAGGLGLAAGEDSHDVTFADAGLRVHHGFNWYGQQAHIGGYLVARRVLSGENPAFAASFAGAPDATFTVDGQRLPKSSQRVGLNLISAAGNRWNWTLDFGVEQASGEKRGTFGAAGMRLAF